MALGPRGSRHPYGMCVCVCVGRLDIQAGGRQGAFLVVGARKRGFISVWRARPRHRRQRRQVMRMSAFGMPDDIHLYIEGLLATCMRFPVKCSMSRRRCAYRGLCFWKKCQRVSRRLWKGGIDLESRC
jgi:hypothetical protein